ncbi:hypothetical protein FJZ19_02500 [Candidatus Pacearchaeota archaeon]|nr:hypothetical protein [Candidatus Pacearchaeota archaeon]
MLQLPDLSIAIAGFLRESGFEIFNDKPYELPRGFLCRQHILVRFGREDYLDSVLMMEYHAPDNEYFWPANFGEEAVRELKIRKIIPTHSISRGFAVEDDQFTPENQSIRQQALELADRIKQVRGVERIISCFWHAPIIVEAT